MSLDSFLFAGVFFAVLMAGFLTACLICAWSDDDEATRSIGLGGADISLPEQLRRVRPDATDYEINHHGTEIRP